MAAIAVGVRLDGVRQAAAGRRVEVPVCGDLAADAAEILLPAFALPAISVEFDSRAPPEGCSSCCSSARWCAATSRASLPQRVPLLASLRSGSA
jgi:hypothetical protein